MKALPRPSSAFKLVRRPPTSRPILRLFDGRQGTIGRFVAAITALSELVSTTPRLFPVVAYSLLIYALKTF
jgi:hypothetical protein